MYRMFYSAELFRQDLCEWTVNSNFPDDVGTVDMFLESNCRIQTVPTDVNVCQGCFICDEEKGRVPLYIYVQTKWYSVDIIWDIIDMETNQVVFSGDEII